MAKNIRRMLAMVLVMCMFVSALPMQALAAEDGTTTETTVNDGVKTEVTTTQSTSTDSSGNVTVTVEFSSTSSGTTSSGSSVSGSASGTSTTVTDSANNVVEASSSSVASTTTTTGNTSTTVTETKQGETSTTPVEGSTTPDAEGFTSQGGSQTTVVESTETTTEVNTEDSKGRPLYESEKVEGEETTVTTTTEVKTKQEVIDTTPTITDNPYENVENTEGTYQDVPGATGSQDTFKDAVITEKPDDVTLNMSQSDKIDETYVDLDVEKVVSDNIVIPDEGTTEVKNSDGSITYKTITHKKNDAGIIIGYTVTEETKTVDVQEDQEYTRGESSPGEGNGATANVPVEPKHDETFTLPEKPKGGVTTDENGNTVTVTVEEVKDENGDVIGYKSNIEITDKHGDLVEKGSETIYGTITKTDVTTEKTGTDTVIDTTLTKDKVTTTTYYKITDAMGEELVVLDGKWYYKAQLDAVREGTSHGAVTITPVTPDAIYLSYDGYNKQNVGIHNNGYSAVKNPNQFKYDEETPNDEYSVYYDGYYGEGSDYQVFTKENGYPDTSNAHTFIVTDDAGNKFTVYCIDHHTTAYPGFEYVMENIADATYYQGGADAREHIQAIGMNGYWGNNTGIGSLQHVKNQLKAAYDKAKETGESFILTEEQVNQIVGKLTEGEAMTATQAAFWQFGNKSSSVKIQETQATDNISWLMKWLASIKEPTNNSTDMIDAEDFAQNASITVKDKVSEANDSTPAKYKTDVTFSLAVEATADDDLLVHVIVDGEIIETRRLAGTNKDGETYKYIAPDMSGNYTLNDLELASGVNLTLNLKGTQNIEEGVYIYTSEVIDGTTAQTYVGLSAGERQVDLSVNMNFTVTDPKAQVKDPGAKPAQQKIDILRQRKTDTETKKYTTYDVKVTTTVTDETGRQWESFKEKEYTYHSDPSTTGFRKGGKVVQPQIFRLNNQNLVEIPEEPVPLATPAITGDNSFLWIAVVLLSLSCMVAVNIFDKKNQHEAF